MLDLIPVTVVTSSPLTVRVSGVVNPSEVMTTGNFEIEVLRENTN
jgi:hypothetical protein